MWYLTQWQLRSYVESMAAKGSDALENYFNNRRQIKQQINYKNVAVFFSQSRRRQRSRLERPLQSRGPPDHIEQEPKRFRVITSLSPILIQIKVILYQTAARAWKNSV